ncbi:MAG: carbohydrate ABC transporter permease [Actinomycetota bacterium]|nr:carbohydrate ABC transporter permease [Actinomycetota bacterium]
MTTAAAPVASQSVAAVARDDVQTSSGRVKKHLTSRAATITALVIAVLWTIPTAGLFISSLRPAELIRTTGWWTFFTNPSLTLQNYDEVLFSSSSGSGQLAGYFVNSIVITIPTVLFALALAAFAAYALAWIPFKGSGWLFIGIFALQIVPLQMALIPLLRIFSSDALDPVLEYVPYLSLWLAHTAFALPLAIFLLHNFISEVPGELIEAARVDGAGHVTIFRRIMLPLLVPAIASIVIFQFIWVWNDLLVGLTFAGGTDDVAPITVRLAELAGTRGNEWQRLTAGAFVSFVLPLVVFLSLQRYFVRGLLAGSVKG